MTIEEAKLEIGKILDELSTSENDNLHGIESQPAINDSGDETFLEDIMKLHPVGDCKMPESIDELPSLSISSKLFQAPATIDNRDYCLKTLNQGQLPWCAAYTAKMFCEVVKWMERDYPDQNVISAETIYKYAKSIDGDPNGDGTTLVAVLQALLDKGIFDKNKCKIQVIRKNSMSREYVKYAIHKFGTLPSAFNCTSEWYTLNKNKTCITGNGPYRICGGHAVLIDYYDRNGVGFCNSWGEDYGMYGHGMMTWKMFDEQFLYASCITNVFDGLKMNI